MSTVKGCPFCLRTDQVRYDDETALVQFSNNEPEEEVECDAIYYFDCCQKAIAILYARPRDAAAED
jgi:hypothetical protein